VMARRQDTLERRRRSLGSNREAWAELHFAPDVSTREAPIVAAVEPRTARVIADTAAHLARELGAPLIFVTVRARPPAVLGEPYYQRRLTRGLFRGKKTLDTALAAASRHGVMAYGEILEGDAAAQVVQFARARRARLLVVGQRPRRLRPSVARRVIRAAGRPVVVVAKSDQRIGERDAEGRLRPPDFFGAYVGRRRLISAG
jgi:nucleotide-binding universal stress UspA family protein